jgi:hypothetical protein
LPVGQFWFLYTLSLLSILYFAMSKLQLGPERIFGVFAIGACVVNQWHVIEWEPLRQALRYGPFTAIGALVCQTPALMRLPGSLSPRVANGIALFGGGLLSVLNVIEDGTQPALGVLSAIVGIVSAVSLASALRGHRCARVAGFLGCLSLEIYVAHTIPCSRIRIVLAKFAGVHDASLHLAVGTCGGIGGPLLLVWGLRQLGADWLFRLQPRRIAQSHLHGSGALEMASQQTTRNVEPAQAGVRRRFVPLTRHARAVPHESALVRSARISSSHQMPTLDPIVYHLLHRRHPENEIPG